jgi:hypothetical protein
MTVLTIFSLLATIAIVCTFAAVFQHKPDYVGHITLHNQQEYHTFLDALFTTDVIALDGQPEEVLPANKEEIWNYSEFPVEFGFRFKLSNEIANPIAQFNAVSYPANTNTKLILTACIAITGLAITLGLWLGRNGFYDEKCVMQLAK